MIPVPLGASVAGVSVVVSSAASSWAKARRGIINKLAIIIAKLIFLIIIFLLFFLKWFL
jgi:hypothetical protein